MTNAIWLSPNSFVSDLFRDGYRDETDRQTHVTIFIAAKKPTPKEEKVGREIIIIIRNVGETCGKLTGENHKSVKPKKTSQTDVRRHSWISFQMAAAILRFLLRLGFVVLAPTTSPGNQETKFECAPRLFRTNEKRHGGQDYLRLALFSFFMNPFKKETCQIFRLFRTRSNTPAFQFPSLFSPFFYSKLFAGKSTREKLLLLLLFITRSRSGSLAVNSARLEIEREFFFDPQFRRWNVIQNV